MMSDAVPMIMYRVLSTGCDMIVGSRPVHMPPGSGRLALRGVLPVLVKTSHRAAVEHERRHGHEHDARSQATKVCPHSVHDSLLTGRTI
jgi:hypothetical protein